MERACRIYWKLHASKKASFKGYRGYLKQICQFFQGRFIDTISYLDVEAYRKWRCEKVSESTVNREHTTIIHIYNALRRWMDMKIIKPVTLPKANPGSLVKKAQETGRKRILSQEEVQRLLDCSSPQLRDIFLMALNTLLRRKDLRQLSMKSVSQLTESLEGIQAKTGKPYCIPLNPVIRSVINRAKGDRILDFTNFRREFDAAVSKAMITNFHFKDLRRTGARRMLKAGFDIAVVSQYLGHRTIRMTQVYVGAEAPDIAEASQFMGEAFPLRVA